MIKFAMGLVLMVVAMAATANPLFEDDGVLAIEFEGPWSELFDDEGNSLRSFQLTAAGVKHPVKVKMGGKSRRRVCSFPPLFLRFEHGTGVAGDLFYGQDYLRMVTHCRDSRSAAANVIEEYLAYRILNILTEFSYRVRLVQIDYVDSEDADENYSSHAFFIEPAPDLARRLGARLLTLDGLPKSQLNEEHGAIAYVFQYLIGNTDWSLVTGEGEDYCCHNGQLIGVENEIFYIPYDFDITGLVNPRYAKPDPSLRITRVTRRLYRGYCGPPEALRKALAQVVDRHSEIIELYRRAPVLTVAERDKGIRFLEAFFRKAEDQEKLAQQFERQCLD